MTKFLALAVSAAVLMPSVAAASSDQAPSQSAPKAAKALSVKRAALYPQQAPAKGESASESTPAGRYALYIAAGGLLTFTAWQALGGKSKRVSP